jgi:hypothetical protein
MGTNVVKMVLQHLFELDGAHHADGQGQTEPGAAESAVGGSELSAVALYSLHLLAPLVPIQPMKKNTDRYGLV